jgi:hypothetical protein
MKVGHLFINGVAICGIKKKPLKNSKPGCMCLKCFHAFRERYEKVHKALGDACDIIKRTRPQQWRLNKVDLERAIFGEPKITQIGGMTTFTIPVSVPQKGKGHIKVSINQKPSVK